MSPYDSIEARFHFKVPEVFRVMAERRVLQDENPDGLYLTDLRWLTPSEIATYTFLPIEAPGLVPFGKSARADLFAWRPTPASDTSCHPAPVVFCPRDCDTAHYYAPDFTAALYRLLLEEFSGTWLTESFSESEALRRLRWYPFLLSSWLPQAWVGELKRISSGPLREYPGGVTGFFPRAECHLIIEQALAFPLLNTEFQHYLPL